MENFRYPTTDMGLEALVKKPEDPAIRNWRAGGYLRATTVPKDPWGNPVPLHAAWHQGAAPTTSTPSAADGEVGGEGVDADIGSWNLQ